MHIVQAFSLLSKTLHNTFDNAPQVAYWLLEKLTGLSQAHIRVSNAQLTEEQIVQLHVWIRDIIENHKPLQYILEVVPFLDLTLFVEPPILIPRPETEEWCSLLIQKLRQANFLPNKILDLCSGTGCIGLSLARAFPNSNVTAVDIDAQACALIEKNRNVNAIQNLTVLQSDLFAQLQEECFDLIVANPPYLAEREWHTLKPHVKDWESRTALVAPHDGLALIENIIQGAPTFLTQHAKNASIANVWVEIGSAQAPAVADIFRKRGYTALHIINDFSGNPRVVCGSAA